MNLPRRDGAGRRVYSSYWKTLQRATEDRRRDFLQGFFESAEAQDVLGDRTTTESQRLYRKRANTERAYLADQRPYITFMKAHGANPLAPTSELWEAFFAEHTAPARNGKRRAYATVTRNYYGIGNLFFSNRLPSPTRTPLHKALMRSLQREDAHEVVPAVPLRTASAKMAMDKMPEQDLRSLRDKTIFAIGATRGFRAASITGLQIDNIRFETKGVILGLRCEKTCSSSQLVYTGTCHTREHRHCMPCLIGQLRNAMAEYGYTSGPLIRRIDRWGHVGCDKLSTKSVTQILRLRLSQADVQDAAKYSSHSFRHGVVQSAVENGLRVPEVMQITMHRSRRGLEAYMTRIDPWRNSSSLSLCDLPDASTVDAHRGWIHGR